MNNRISKIMEYFKGNTSNKSMKISILIFAIGYAMSLIVARLFFPGFTMTRMFISNLGDPQDNPVGYIPWSLGHVLVGMIMIPMTGFLKNTLNSIDQKKITISTIFFYIASIGVIGLGAIPQYPGYIFTIIHGVNAGLLIGGIHFGLWITAITLFKNGALRKQSGIIFGLSLIGLIGILVSQLTLLVTVGVQDSYPFVFDLHFWEWMMMCCFFGAFLLLVFSVSQDKREWP